MGHLIILFWLMEAAYCIHCIDEIFVGRGFVNMTKKYFWGGYNRKLFFWFNTAAHICNITSIIIYGALGGAWVVIPLSISWVFVTNGFWHVLATAIFKEYSPGLGTSALYWLIIYLIMRYGDIRLSYYICSIITGTIITSLMIGSLFIVRRKTHRVSDLKVRVTKNDRLVDDGEGVA